MIVGGIDVGSLSTKALIMENEKIKGWSLIFTGPDSAESAKNALDIALKEAKVSLDEVQYMVATGYGRVNVPFAQNTVTEISCHARGSHWLFPDVRTILDMGGQDCKAIRCDENGNLISFFMNDKCAAGTGRYLERVAAVLGVELGQIGPLSLHGINGPLEISGTCVVFAESDIMKLMREGNHRNDILAGAADAIVGKIIALLERVGVERELCVSGGVAKNVGVVSRLEKKFGLKAFIAFEPQIVGALGAALFAADKLADQKNS